MVKEILVLRDTGIPLFHYSFDGRRKVDEIVAAFLSAIGSFAQEASDQQLRVISFASNKFIWVQKGDIYFIAFVAAEDSAEIYYVILQEIAEQFIGQYYDLLRNLDMDGVGSALHKFDEFADSIERILQRFEGIPGLARRHKMILLPTQTAGMLKKLLARVEGDTIFRGAAVTHDGYVVVSNLRVYEIEAVLDMLPTILEQKWELKKPMVVGHSGLDSKTTFIVYKLTECVCAFVGRVGVSGENYFERMSPLIQALEKLSLSSAQRLNLEAAGNFAAFHDLDVVKPIQDIADILENSRVHFSGLDESIRVNVLRTLEKINQEIMVGNLSDATGLNKSQLSEVLAILVARGIVRVNRVYPQLEHRDERFTAFLELIGMPKRDYEVLNQIWNYCDGTTSIMEIAQKTGIPTLRVMEVLKKIGNHVTWKTERNLMECD
ncbi:MAG: hypothetical protein ACTSYL_03675 [Candidatus Thorarchaeota archaeon]